MTLPITRQFLRAGATALILSTVTSVSMFVSADAVYAERGGNGNGNGNSGNSERSSNRSDSSSANRSNNGNANRSSNANPNRSSNGNASVAVKSQQVRSEDANGRGVLARELRGLNAAHANQTALENASPNSMPGKLYVYQQEQPQLREDETNAIADVERLTALSAADIAEAYPDGEYAAALEAADVDSETLAALKGLPSLDIASAYPEGEYAGALEAAADDPETLATLQGLSAADIAEAYPDGEYAAALEAADVDSETLAALKGLSSLDIAMAYPSGEFATAVATADQEYQESQQAIIDSILALSGDRDLSDNALAELDRLLDL